MVQPQSFVAYLTCCILKLPLKSLHLSKSQPDQPDCLAIRPRATDLKVDIAHLPAVVVNTLDVLDSINFLNRDAVLNVHSLHRVLGKLLRGEHHDNYDDDDGHRLDVLVSPCPGGSWSSCWYFSSDASWASWPSARRLSCIARRPSCPWYWRAGSLERRELLRLDVTLQPTWAPGGVGQPVDVN